MMKRFDPETYNPTANPSLPRTNSVFPFIIAFVVLGLGMMSAIHWFPRPFHLSPPEIAYSPDHITVSSTASNDTNELITALIRVRIHSARRPSEVDPRVFQEIDRRDASVTVRPHSAEQVAVSFPIKSGYFPNHAELEIVSRR